MRTFPLFRHGILLVLLALTGITMAKTIKPARPTHYFYTPTAYLNEEFEMVASLHEASYALPYKLQLHTSLVDNVGRVCFGARYGIADNLSVGGGLAWSLATPYWGNYYRGGHGILRNNSPRFGMFLTWGIANESNFEAALTPHVQIGDDFSTGGDFGMMITPNPFWSIIGEFGLSFAFTGPNENPNQNPDLYINTIWGVRVHPPKIPFLSFDGGVDFIESRPEEFARRFAPFFDVIFTMDTMN